MKIGVVTIGRNEGERLRKCLESLKSTTDAIVYVDSGSTDNSTVLARDLGVEVVDLNLALPFTAARARNAGFARLLEWQPDIQLVQFVDGDCEVVDGWMELAASYLSENTGVAVICGRRRERYPERSIYNLLCDMEWDTPIGEAKACGGDAMMRVEALFAVGGYREGMIAGEEPELCVRLRALGWRIWRLDAEMTLHDAAMTRFSQWWKRNVRGGHACAEGTFLHGSFPERHRVKEWRSTWLWGAGIPLFIVMTTPFFWCWSFLFLAIYPLQIARLCRRGKLSLSENCLRAFFLVLGKFPETFGQIKFLLDRFSGKKSRLIEYK